MCSLLPGKPPFACALLLTLLTGCASKPDTTDEQLLARYPRGVTRIEILNRLGAPQKNVYLDDPQNQPLIVRIHLKQMSVRFGPPPVSYDVFSVIGGDLWLGPGGASVFLDYVYYDDKQRCIYAGRHKID